MEELLAQAKKVAEEAEVFATLTEETQVKYESNHLKQLQTRQQTSIALRIIKDGKLGYAVSTSLDDREALVRDALEAAQFGNQAYLQFPQRVSYEHIDIYDPAVEAVKTEEMVGLGEAMIGAVTGHTPGTVGEAEVSRGTVTVNIINSRGGQAQYRKSVFNIGMESSLIDGTDMLFVGESQASCHPLLDHKLISDVVIRQIELAGRQAPIAGKAMPAIFTPNGVASALLMPLVSAFNGKNVLEGASPVGDKLGQQAFDGNLSIRDDPTLPYQTSSRPCDDEGVPSKRTPLVENGAVTGFFYDLQTAARAKTGSTGNGGRGRGGQPYPAPTAFIVRPGATSFADMLRDMKEGLVIEFLMGAEQGNVLGGDFSGNVLLGYKVEKGEIVGRVKNTMVSGNIYQLLKNITATGDRPEWVGGMLHTPHLYFPAVAVATTA
jgi:PmbA protein